MEMAFYCLSATQESTESPERLCHLSAGTQLARGTVGQAGLSLAPEPAIGTGSAIMRNERRE